jgi:hypothetical protein
METVLIEATVLCIVAQLRSTDACQQHELLDFPPIIYKD